MLLEHEFNVQNRTALRQLLQPQPFAVVDPDADGAILIYEGSVLPKPSAIFRTLMLGDAIAAARQAGVRLVVVESQFMKQSPMVSVKLARRAMIFPAALAGATYGASPDPVSLVWVFPATWQAWMRGGAGTQQARDDVKAAARDYAEGVLGQDGRWVSANKARKQGIADAITMAGWLRHGFWGFKGGPGKQVDLL